MIDSAPRPQSAPSTTRERTASGRGEIGRRGLVAGAVVVLVLQVGTLAAKEDPWLKVTSPEFTLVTSLREKEAGAWAGEFAQYIAALQTYFSNNQHRLPALTVVVFGRQRDFEKYRPLGANGKPQEVDGFFSRQQTWAVAGLGGGNASEVVRRTIFHEGVHWFTSLQDRQDPVWLDEGLAEVFSTFAINKNQAEWGRPIDSHVTLLRNTNSLPLERLLSTAHGDLFGDDSLHTSIVYAESWAFVHFLIYGKHDFSRKALPDYLELMHGGASPDAAFQRAFGRTYRQMDDLLDRYLMGGGYFISRQPLATVTPPKIEPATPAEVEDALSRLAFAARRWSVAAEHARAEIAVADTDPRGHEMLGRALKESGAQAAAVAEFELAKAHESRDFAPYFELAYAAQTAANDGAGGLSLSPAEARRIASNYERAINLHPTFLLSYQNLAGVVGIAEPWGETDRQFLELGQKLFPRDAMIKIGHALLLRRAGDNAAARALLDEVLAPEAETAGNARAYARRIDTTWEQQEIFERVNRLGEAQKFTEALAFVDERLERGVDSSLRPQLLRTRESLEAAVQGQQLQQALAHNQWTEARRLAGELLFSKAEPQIKQQARRTLEELDRRKLGLEDSNKPPASER